MVVVSCSDPPDLSTREDMLRSALSRQLDAEKADGLLSNPEAMERPAASVSVVPKSVFASCRPAPLEQAAAVSARSDALAALPVASLSPTLTNILWPEDIGTAHQWL